MNADNHTFIFYLTLDENLPEAFYTFDRTLRDQGFFLIPVNVGQLQGLLASSEQEQIVVISSVTDSREYKLFSENIRGFLKYVLRSKRMTFLLLSSFCRLDDSRLHILTRNYFFLKYPLDARLLAASIARYHGQKSQKSTKWPGGKRAGVKVLGA